MLEMNYNFKCSACGGTKIEEVITDLTQYRVITSFDENSDPVYGDCNVEDGNVLHYQCDDCGQVIKDQEGYKIDNSQQLMDYLEWVKEQHESKDNKIETSVDLSERVNEMDKDALNETVFNILSYLFLDKDGKVDPSRDIDSDAIGEIINIGRGIID